MIIGVPKEIKEQESRVACTPAAVYQLVQAGHTVYVETGAGVESGFTDDTYEDAGAQILDQAKDVWEKSDFIYKVKEPLASEYKYFREGLILYTYLHLAANPELTKALVESKVTAVAFETVEEDHKLPLLKPMSEVAGRMAVQEGAHFLTKPNGGKGIVLQGVPGVQPAHVVVVGGGTVGTAATRIAVGMGARVTVLDVNIERLGELFNIFGDKIETLFSNPYNIEKCVKHADMVISTILIPGRKAPKLITEDMVKEMEAGSVIVDVAIDQGGSTELTENHPTTHHDPVFVKHDVIHYAVANIPGAVAVTSTAALSNSTTKYALTLAKKGWKEAIRESEGLRNGLNTVAGYVTNKGIADDLGLDYKNVDDLV